jgi:leucyl-tRNA synthetase
LDTFVCSSWYYLRYPSNRSEDAPFEEFITRKMLPIDLYCGGAEHSCMHLIYMRFICRALNTLGFVNFKEPSQKLVHQGMILGSNGLKMSKSRDNSASPDELVSTYGSDCLRFYLAFGFNFQDGGPWQNDGIVHAQKFLEKVDRIIGRVQNYKVQQNGKANATENDEEMRFAVHSALFQATQDFEDFKFNTAIARIMELTRSFSQYLNSDMPDCELMDEVGRSIVQLLAPVAPHQAEEWWRMLGHETSIFHSHFPKPEAAYVSYPVVQIGIMINGKRRGECTVSRGCQEEEAVTAATAHSNIQRYISQAEVRKIIFVQDRMINFII